MSLRATMRVAYLLPDEARRAAAAIEPDNEGFLVSRIEDNTLVLEATGAAGTVLHTLDDALACLRSLQA